MRDAPGLERGPHHFPPFPLVNLAGRLRAECRGVVSGEAVTPFAAVDVEKGVEEGETVVFRLGSQVFQELWRTVQRDDSAAFPPFCG